MTTMEMETALNNLISDKGIICADIAYLQESLSKSPKKDEINSLIQSAIEALRADIMQTVNNITIEQPEHKEPEMHIKTPNELMGL